MKIKTVTRYEGGGRLFSTRVAAITCERYENTVDLITTSIKLADSEEERVLLNALDYELFLIGTGIDMAFWPTWKQDIPVTPEQEMKEVKTELNKFLRKYKCQLTTIRVKLAKIKKL